MKITKLAALGLAALLMAGTAQAETTKEYTLTLKDHVFTPATLEIPADQQAKITVVNQDPTAEEFDSDDLDREKVIAGGDKGIVLLGPLKPGTYNFAGEYNEDTAKGQVIVK